MRVLVTGAEGFVGGRLVRRLAAVGHEVTAAVHRRPGSVPGAAEVRVFDLRDTQSVRDAAEGSFHVVVHLAAVTSGTDAREDPGVAWDVNAAGTVRLCEALAVSRSAAPRVLLASTAEVYGVGAGRSRSEADPAIPCSPYAASKLGAEIGAGEVGRRRRYPLIIARLFPHTGAGQDTRFVVPAFARRIREADLARRPEVSVGNLDAVRDFLHVEDVVDAYMALIERGKPGRCYNVASGSGVPIREIFEKLRVALRANVRAAVDPGLMRPADIQHLVGDATRLQEDTGWRPRRTLDEVLDEVARAEAH